MKGKLVAWLVHMGTLREAPVHYLGGSAVLPPPL